MSRLQDWIKRLEQRCDDGPSDGLCRLCWDGEDCTDHEHDIVLRWDDRPEITRPHWRKDSDEEL
jgi:hypothetical protein